MVCGPHRNRRNAGRGAFVAESNEIREEDLGGQDVLSFRAGPDESVCATALMSAFDRGIWCRADDQSPPVEIFDLMQMGWGVGFLSIIDDGVVAVTTSNVPPPGIHRLGLGGAEAVFAPGDSDPITGLPLEATTSLSGAGGRVAFLLRDPQTFYLYGRVQDEDRT